jgi:hypothetical protein
MLKGVAVGLSVLFIGFFCKQIYKKLSNKDSGVKPVFKNVNRPIINNNINFGNIPKVKPFKDTLESNNINEKTHVSVLFIDDETDFKIVDIINKQPYATCKIIRDIDSFDSKEIREADVIFVDVDGVGETLTPKERGLGIVLGIKSNFPSKKVIIYSGNTKRDMTHPALKVADGILNKNAQPSDFLKYIN